MSEKPDEIVGERNDDAADDDTRYARASRLAVSGEFDKARKVYNDLERQAVDATRRALIRNDLAALDAATGDLVVARRGFQTALRTAGNCWQAALNLETLKNRFRDSTSRIESADVTVGLPRRRNGWDRSTAKIAILSLLFNWPSTGGGIIHTVELARFLGRAGFEVRHFYARSAQHGIGRVDAPLPIDSSVLDFDLSHFTQADIQDRFRRAVSAFEPNYVIITDSWNFKPLLAKAVRDFPYFIRQQSLECICPLNNLRLLVDDQDHVRQCPTHQFADPNTCRACLAVRGMRSGALHRMERELSGVESPGYTDQLFKAFADAEAVLVLNPQTRELLVPYAKNVQVVPWGMDPARFPWPWPDVDLASVRDGVKRIFMAGVVEELIKGFHVAVEACEMLWKRRHDFELVATGNPPGRVNDFTRFVGWLSQAELPRHLRAADMVLMPTIAQEGLGRSTVEAMAVGRPVIASRIGGLPFTVTDGVTGLLTEPGDAGDLAAKIETLLDNPQLCTAFGLAGRKCFEDRFTWEHVIETYYRPLFSKTCQPAAGRCN